MPCCKEKIVKSRTYNQIRYEFVFIFLDMQRDFQMNKSVRKKLFNIMTFTDIPIWQKLLLLPEVE